MNKALSFMLFMGLILVFSIGIISANTLVGGKIYNSDYSQPIAGANVVVTCGNILTTTSLSDGTYAVVFNFTESCNASNSVKVTASKDNLYGEGTSIINNSTEGEGEFVAVANINMKVKSTTDSTTSSGGGGGGGSGRYYMCGNGKCDSGETSQTCLMDCPVVVEEETPTGLLDLSYNSGDSGDRLSGEETQNSDNTGNNLGITGAVTGITEFATSPGGIATSSGLIIILIGSIILINLRKNRLSKEK